MPVRGGRRRALKHRPSPDYEHKPNAQPNSSYDNLNLRS